MWLLLGTYNISLMLNLINSTWISTTSPLYQLFFSMWFKNKKNVTYGTTCFILKFYTNKDGFWIPFMMAVVRCQRARFSNPLLILCSWDSSFFLHYHLRGHSPLNAHALCAFHSSCSPIMDYCHLVEKQGWLPDGSFAISGSKVK